MRSELSMSKQRLFLSLSLLSLVATVVACDSGGAGLHANLTLSLAQTSTGMVHYARADAYQSGTQVGGAVLDDNGMATLSIAAGIETRLDVTDFEIESQVWNAYQGSQIFEPVPGDNQVSVAVARVPLRQVDLLPSFEGAYALDASFPIEVKDDATEFAPIDPNPFVINDPLFLPTSRSFTVTFTRPDTQESIPVPVPANSDEPVAIPLGAPPILMAPPPIYLTSGTQIDLSGFEVPGFTVECRAGYVCDDSPGWSSCTSTFETGFGADEQGTLMVQIRIREIPELCVSVEVVRDLTPPAASIRVDPPFLNSDSTGDLTITVTPSESLQSVTATLSGGLVTSCASFTPIASTNGGPSTYSCVVSLTGWDGTRDISINATITDLAGNTPAASPSALIPVLTSSQDLVIVGVHTWPPQLMPSSYSTFLIGVDVVHTGKTASALCDLQVQTGGFYTDPDPLIAPTPDGTLQLLVPGNARPILPLPSGGPSARYTIWTTAMTEIDGIQQSDFWLGGLQVNYAIYNGLDCGGGINTTQTYTPPMRFPIVFVAPNPGPLTSNPIVVGLPPDRGLTGYGVAGDLPLIIPNKVSGGGYDSQQPDVASFPGDSSEWYPKKVGTAEVRVPDGSGNVMTRFAVQVVPGNEVLALQEHFLVRLSATGSSKSSLAPEVGVALRVLWESSRNTIAVAGNQGVELFVVGSDTPVLLPAPCGMPPPDGTAVILDAALTAIAPAYSQAAADLVLLFQDDTGFGQCNVGLDPPHSVTLTRFSAAILDSCASPETLRIDSESGRALLVGTGAGGPCAVVLDESRGTPTPRSSISGGLSGLVSRTTDVAVDWSGDFAAYGGTNMNSAPIMGALGLGPSLLPIAGTEYDLVGSMRLQGPMPRAITMHPRTGAIMVAVDATDASNPQQGAYLDAFAHRYPATVGAGGLAPTQQLRGLGSAYTFSHLIIDPSYDMLFAADTWKTPGVWPVRTGNPQLTDSLSLGTEDPTVDLAIAGPEPLDVTPRILRGGGLATIHGHGFAGGRRDEVYVMGVRGDVLSSTTTSITFRVPQALDVPDMPFSRAWLEVRAFDRMSGPVTTLLTIEPMTPDNLISYTQGGSLPECATGGCAGQPRILDMPDAYWVLRDPASQDTLDTLSSLGYISGTTIPGAGAKIAVQLAGGRRAIGFVSPNTWRDYWAPAVPAGAPLLEPLREFSGAATAGTTALAADPAGRYVASAGSGGTRLWYTSSLEAVGTGVLSGGTINNPTALAFTLDGRYLIAASSTATFDIYGLDPSATLIQAGQTATGCPTGIATLLSLDTAYAEPDAVTALLAYGTTTLTKIARATVRVDPTGVAATCETAADLPRGALRGAAMSPLSDLVAVAENISPEQTPDRVRLLDATDLSRERYRTAISWTPNLLQWGQGRYYGPELVWANDSSIGGASVRLGGM